MDDFEFRKRALANPQDTDEDFAAAASASAQRTQLLQDLQALDARISAIAHSVQAPPGLADRLKAQAGNATQATVTVMPTRSRYQRYYAMAASLVITVGVILSSSFGTARPSA